MNLVEMMTQARALGAELHLDGDRVKVSAASPLPDVLLEALRQSRAEIRCQLIIEQAFALADQVSDALGIADPLTREINRLGWAVCDLQDAGCPESAWGLLRERELALGRD